MKAQNILLVNPKYPETFWSFEHALKFISKKASNPPLGLLTVASMLPTDWNKKLVDLNVKPLKDEDIEWADMIFLSAMVVQHLSVKKVIARCKALDKKIVAGGPLFTEEYEDFPEVDHLVLNEAEITLPDFMMDFFSGNPKRIYQSETFADMKDSPVPDYSLIDISKYATLSIQYSRGCPYDCEFCDITALLGRKVRIKTTEQILLELTNLYQTGFRGNIFFVDDNFIGNKRILKKELLPAVIHWMQAHKDPFTFTTEASINLADDKQLMDMMVKAGFSKVFVGIETPDKGSLAECNKTQNKHRNLLHCVRKIQSEGMEVTAGFIVGFDNDSPSIFDRQIEFIQKSGIISAMVGLLNAPKKTKLYSRLKKEGRIIDTFSGDNTNYSLNFIPKMDKQVLLDGYQKIINGIYSSKPYYERVLSFLKNYQPEQKHQTNLSVQKILALLKSILILGIKERNRSYYWRLFFWSLFNRPKLFPLAITYSIYGYHYRKTFKNLQ